MTAEGLCFIRVLSKKPVPRQAELIVSFEGRDGRAQTAYKLAEDADAATLVISPATRQRLKAYDRRYRPKKRIKRIVEKKARTTFENAFYTRDIAEKNGFDTVILVTSWDHMPRAYMLLRIMLIGSGTRIFPHPVPTGPLNRDNWYHHANGWKMIFNEMVETWGSLIEYAHYRTSGRLPKNQPGKRGFFSGLKKIILFDIDPAALSAAVS